MERTIELTTRAINAALRRNRFSSANGVYAFEGREKYRIYHAKTIKGTLYVCRLSDGHWFTPDQVVQ